MDDTLRNRTAELARLLEDNKGRDTLALDISGASSWADFLIITTANSHAHMRGLLRLVRERIHDWDLNVRHLPKGRDDDEWLLIDATDVVINIMTERARGWYELEERWFEAPVAYQSSNSS